MKVLLRDDIEHIGQLELDSLLARLPQWRRDQALRFRHLPGKRESAAAFLLLADALQTDFGITDIPPFSFTSHGKPYLAEYPAIHFNLSHCRSAVLCVISESPVGCDIETIRKASPDLVSYTMNASEQAIIMSASDPDLAFTTLWTRKEACLKLTGEGVGNYMHDVLLPERLYENGISITSKACCGYVYSIAEYVEQ